VHLLWSVLAPLRGFGTIVVARWMLVLSCGRVRVLGSSHSTPSDSLRSCTDTYLATVLSPSVEVVLYRFNNTVTISYDTFAHHLCADGYVACIACLRPPLSPQH
jgi:hypothetical protein